MTSNSAQTCEMQEDFVLRLMESADIIDDQIAQNLYRAFLAVDRSQFVIDSQRDQVFQDISLEIEHKQFTPKPSVIVRMLSLLGELNQKNTLEIGCGTGYTAALLSEMGSYVFTAEVIGQLAQFARKQLDALGYQNVILHRGDGFDGWPDQAPFDRILFSTVVKRIPEVIFDQLADGGRIVAPIRVEDQVILNFWVKSAGECKSFQMESIQFDGNC